MVRVPASRRSSRPASTAGPGVGVPNSRLNASSNAATVLASVAAAMRGACAGSGVTCTSIGTVAHHPADERWLAAMWPFVREHLPPAPARILELGCGPLGGFVPRMSALGTTASAWTR